MSVTANTPPSSNSPVNSSPSFKGAIVSLAKSPAFVTTASLLLVSALALNVAVDRMQLHFRKQPVDLQSPLKSLPKQFGPWVQVSIDNPLSHDMEEVLGTKDYIFRDFVDTTKVPAIRMAEFDGKDWQQRQSLAWRLQAEFPTAVLRMSVTYYTGMVDTVAHIPDRCFVADGFVPTVYETPHWKIPGFMVDSDGKRLDGQGIRTQDPYDSKQHTDDGLPVRFINFEDQDNRYKNSTRNVTYFFQVNGRYVGDPIGVRRTLQNLFEKNGYYAKVELMTLLRDKDQSAEVKQNFLRYALPQLESAMPDWKAVVTGTVKPRAATSQPTTQMALGH